MSGSTSNSNCRRPSSYRTQKRCGIEMLTVILITSFCRSVRARLRLRFPWESKSLPLQRLAAICARRKNDQSVTRTGAASFSKRSASDNILRKQSKLIDRQTIIFFVINHLVCNRDREKMPFSLIIDSDGEALLPENLRVVKSICHAILSP